MYRRKNTTAGFTLIELVMYMGLMSILLTVVVTLFSSIVNLRLETEATSSVEEDSKYIFSRLSYDIVRADTVVTPASAGSSSANLEITIDGTTHTYALHDGNLRVSNTDTILLNGFNSLVSDVSFERLENNHGDVSIKVRYTVRNKTLKVGAEETKTVETTIGVR